MEMVLTVRRYSRLALMLCLLIAYDLALLSAQPLQPDTARDQAFHSTIRQFLEEKLASEQLETELQKYARQFEEQPYRIRLAALNMQQFPRERVFALMDLVFAVCQPTVVAWSQRQLTTAQAAAKIAPFCLMWRGFGLESDPGGTGFTREEACELMAEVATFVTP